MNPFFSTYCRIFQTVFRLSIPVMPYRYPKILHSVNDIPAELSKIGKKRVAIITDAYVDENLSTPLKQALSSNDVYYVVFNKAMPNPTKSAVEAAFKMYIENKCDSIIGIGGGSSIDLAKAVGARVTYPKKDLNKMSGILKVLRPIPPLFAIPTTAGTGSEVTLASIITDDETRHKYCINSFPLIPKYAVLDAGLCVSLPKSLTATTGMDALTHAVEAYIGRSTTKETRGLAEDAVKLIFDNILNAYENPTDIDARSNMLLAAYKAGAAFTKSYVGYVHAVAHSLGGQYNIPHGFANAVILPHVLELYGASAHKKLSRLAMITGIANESDSYEQAANKFIDKIKALNEAMDIPKYITGIVEEDIPHMAYYADKEANPLYPVPKLLNKHELEQIYHIINQRS